MTKTILKKNRGPVPYEAKGFRSGFVILFAVTLASLILSIALSVANITFKEISFSTSSRNSSDAFLAADTGAECALFYDKLSGSSFPLDGVGHPATINCTSADLPLSFVGTADTGSYDFIITGLGSLGTSCAKVNVFKNKAVTPPLAIIDSVGYNIGDASCNSTNPNRVERELFVTSAFSISSGPTAFIVNKTLGTLRNDYGDWLGVQFTVGASPVTVEALGRIMVSGNTGTHTVKLVKYSDGLDVSGGSVSINMTGGTSGGFKYTNLASPVVLSAGATYYLVSQEVNGGDQWYDYDTTVTSTSVATVDGSIYWNGGWIFLAPANRMLVPVDFVYSIP
ncbi:hypothetical protein A3A95_02045 [Candidatus Nomurabacteria bacterium RIFCSPLOWO2_01_FULL_39_18]|uniref:Type 4 fimbrial biogenesis protein PilX N-terminal domain-containing protein n=1 Tax=Candidatus Nomurabacteria bacterium RIFCSPHIGHO2_01_FULL_40_24b TaxID=1801739 RepID=A0A1F6V9M7_9BACT|nr:MAG: hypothetical protein A2647_00670 [Candidatus Nomurabacteria bacterium RIFCSPHIGHO2_01_FULL_40_24b]OGI90645.1 MAG: hypothetical protein A3A95_02045 [Candidatus Nomurabacteria bacterium RIFCSPLOWO2_01_FULL_39_18]